MNEEISAFKALRESNTGKVLIAFLEKELVNLCDVRNHPEVDPRAKILAAEYIETIIKKIKVGNKNKDVELDQYN